MSRFAKRVARVQTLDIWIVVATTEMLASEMIAHGFELVDDALSDEQVKATYHVKEIIGVSDERVTKNVN